MNGLEKIDWKVRECDIIIFNIYTIKYKNNEMIYVNSFGN